MKDMMIENVKTMDEATLCAGILLKLLSESRECDRRRKYHWLRGPSRTTKRLLRDAKLLREHIASGKLTAPAQPSGKMG